MRARNAADLVAIDGSIGACGVAVFRRGELTAARTIKRSRDASDFGSRAHAMALDVVAWLVDLRYEPACVVYEWPQIYAVGKSKGDPNDLIPLAAVGATVAGMVTAGMAMRQVVVEVVAPTPAQWIGQLPKSRTGDPWLSPRGRRIAKRLSDAERGRVSGGHDSIDGVGLGLWALGRLDRERVLPGAT